MDTRVEHRLECCICGSEEVYDDGGEYNFAMALFDDGWRYETSEKFAVMGAMCPTCAQLPDEERGED
jgi:hypothetical protein